MYYRNIFDQNNLQLNKKLFDVNKQIASGLKIQYAKDDVTVFTKTMRLDNEITTLLQIKQSTESGYKISNQSDVVLNEFETSMNRMRTLMLGAANGVNDETSINALAGELRGIEKNLKSLSNSSIDGKYLFSGSLVDTKPIADDGSYRGNDKAINSFGGSNVQERYNLPGSELFLGEESVVRREITTNVIQKNLSATYGDFTDPTIAGSGSSTLTGSNTIRDMMGDSDNNIDTVNAKHFFYVQGVKSDGSAVKQKIAMRDDQTVDELLTSVGKAFGNTTSLNLVNVSINGNGNIVVQDKQKGSSKLDFHMVAATDLSGGAAADVTDINSLDSGETSFEKIMEGTSSAANSNLYVREFVKSPFTPATGVASNIAGLLYDNVDFEKSGSNLSSNVPQIIRGTNAFATDATKLSEVADLSQGTADTLDGTQFVLSGKNVYGTAFNVQIDLSAAGSTFSLNGGTTNYSIFDVSTPRAAVAADDMTYKQLMDVMNMVATNNIPASTTTDTDYDAAVSSAESAGRTYLSYDGKITFSDNTATQTKAQIALYDGNSSNFAQGASVMSFQANNSLTVKDPKTDFFKEINEMISAVENNKTYPDSDNGDMRNVGIENAIAMMDDLQNHVFRAHAIVGAQSNILDTATQRATTLKVSTESLRSDVIDTDLAQASLTLQQLTLNYQAMLSTVSKVSQLSLVNYL